MDSEVCPRRCECFLVGHTVHKRYVQETHQSSLTSVGDCVCKRPGSIGSPTCKNTLVICGPICLLLSGYGSLWGFKTDTALKSLRAGPGRTGFENLEFSWKYRLHFIDVGVVRHKYRVKQRNGFGGDPGMVQKRSAPGRVQVAAPRPLPPSSRGTSCAIKRGRHI